MLQCFVKKNHIAPFPGSTVPKLLYVSRIESEESIYPRALHAHDSCAEIILIRNGQGHYSIDGKRCRIQGGDLVLLNSGVVHDEISDINTRVGSYCCAIGDLALNGLPRNAVIGSEESPIVPCGEHFDNILELFQLMFRLLLAAQPGADDSCHYLMMSLLTQVLNLLGQGSQPASPEPGEEGLSVLGSRIKEFIDLHYHEDISLQSISEDLNISPYYLSHVFKEASGYSPVKYLLRRRIGEAQTLLINTDYTVTQVASMVGYDNPSHFNLIFTKHVGMTPLKYRKKYTIKSGI
ncbi:AraC family transcriptional regulator [Sinanaerobacter chloroacetimidivorans]|uniref:Helix-turn-helix transcriptional regulator n=1 Tax=Sinanaerobacter chloroacetimidivorans TaxID=2818044 RepID=A0A8J7VZU2_9FIRM|nr:AraC family transcriptional regulator [Sinanaerobacter chloroacetimidivorans]MBR0597754.1 helix-turn-helix transcriptional regulator [Sinanaerobacter chloroacetimidivorans]